MKWSRSATSWTFCSCPTYGKGTAGSSGARPRHPRGERPAPARGDRRGPRGAGPHLDALEPGEGSRGGRGLRAGGAARGRGVAAVVAVAVVDEEQQRQHVAQVQVHEHHQHQEVGARADAAGLAQRPHRRVLAVARPGRGPRRLALRRRPLRTPGLRPQARRRHGAPVARAPRGGAAGMPAPRCCPDNRRARARRGR